MPSVSCLFCDVVQFTQLTQALSTTEILVMLNELFGQFDDLMDAHGAYKVETSARTAPVFWVQRASLTRLRFALLVPFSPQSAVRLPHPIHLFPPLLPHVLL